MTDATPELSAEEFRVLVSLAKRAIQTPPDVRKKLEAQGVMITRANFYSDIPLVSEVESSFEFKFEGGPYNLPSVFNPKSISAFLVEIDRYAKEFDPPLEGNVKDPEGFFWNNPAFSWSDAMAYYCVLRHFQPKTVIEIGSGFSTLVALQALKRNGSGELTCVEPFPLPWLAKLAGINLVQEKVQNLNPEFFVDRLSHEGDVLFIDSTHTVKAGSDCLQIYLRILPAIKTNILVHAHDIYLPFPLPIKHAMERQIYWTEQYLLYAYALDNPKVEIIYGSAYNKKFNGKRLDQFMHGRKPSGGGSLWFKLLAKSVISPVRA